SMMSAWLFHRVAAPLEAGGQRAVEGGRSLGLRGLLLGHRLVVLLLLRSSVLPAPHAADERPRSRAGRGALARVATDRTRCGRDGGAARGASRARPVRSGGWRRGRGRSRLSGIDA